MSTIVWRGDAPEVAEIKTATPATVEVDDVFTLTINGKSVAFTATANTVANVTAGINTVWNASTIPEFSEITAVDSTTHVTLTHDTEGVPFTVNATASGNATFTVNTTTTASGPYCVGVAANWSGGSLPANSDDVVFEYSDIDAKYGLDALSAIALTSLTVKQSFTGAIGLPRTNDNDYIEYRTTSLTLGATTIEIGEGDGQGSGRIKINTGNTDATVSIYNSGSEVETDIPTVLLSSLGANSVVNVYKGSVGIAYFAGETATVATLRVGYLENQIGDATVVCGSGVTLTTIVKTGGSLEIESNVTTVTQDAGDITIGGAATVTTLNLNGGMAYDRSTGTFTTVNLLASAVYDLRRSLAAKTITNLNLYKDASFLDPQGIATITNGIDLEQCGLDQVKISRPPNRTWTESAV